MDLISQFDQESPVSHGSEFETVIDHGGFFRKNASEAGPLSDMEKGLATNTIIKVFFS
jgi:hypothetical protein